MPTNGVGLSLGSRTLHPSRGDTKLQEYPSDGTLRALGVLAALFQKRVDSTQTDLR